MPAPEHLMPSDCGIQPRQSTAPIYVHTFNPRLRTPMFPYRIRRIGLTPPLAQNILALLCLLLHAGLSGGNHVVIGGIGYKVFSGTVSPTGTFDITSPWQQNVDHVVSFLQQHGCLLVQPSTYPCSYSGCDYYSVMQLPNSSYLDPWIVDVSDPNVGFVYIKGGCYPCSQSCNGTEVYQNATCSSTSDISCSPCTQCPNGTFETSPCGGGNGTTDRACKTCTECGPSEYEVSPCNTTHDRVCRACELGYYCYKANKYPCPQNSVPVQNGVGVDACLCNQGLYRFNPSTCSVCPDKTACPDLCPGF
ncbi:hypothetical protein GUITHDRAFT_121421 [Guillardia theta CCMP2712]|uniref:TNFR-Cys domain-containing protein n=1 Tax=Guillardia theta (strain CCMP2712) TaxID=905079 RepID=L1I8L1_GUITC|nr:hypothetical protein GUITHDRAFT_121421 [Guillardia theta CCMP2712]EKX32417.1 hypothetical protein GUITHDRAFT_121421 [Guillardia theta CCMP2712]|eukprot:XP_005819397.1 hypothetical protein GUITHDRAFT_121421 [Guillardia theta CCMP2712]